MRDDIFTTQFNRLTEAFTVARPTDKAKVYFGELDAIDGDIFRSAVTYIIRNEDRFPTISRLLSAVGRLTPKPRTKQEECAVCNGFGWVFIWGVAYRGRCSHGEKLSEKITTAPLDEEGIAEERSKQKQAQAAVYGVVKEPFTINATKAAHYWR